MSAHITVNLSGTTYATTSGFVRFGEPRVLDTVYVGEGMQGYSYTPQQARERAAALIAAADDAERMEAQP